MRINIYSEELTDEIQVVEKTANGNKFIGVRLILESPDTLHNDPDDDDRNAITFWINEDEVDKLGILLQRAERELAHFHYGR